MVILLPRLKMFRDFLSRCAMAAKGLWTRQDRAPKALGLARGHEDRLPIVETPFGRLCTLIGYDGFREPHTREERFVVLGPRLAARGGVTVVANPAANSRAWNHAEPPDEHASRAAQWDRDGLAGSLTEMPFARWGVTAHLVGSVLDLSFDGRSEILERDVRGVVRLAQAEAHDRGGHVTAVVTC